MLFQYYFVPLFFALASCEAASSRIVSGTAPFRYEYQEDYLEIPEQVKNNLLNGHGLTKDKDGNVYFTFQPMNVASTTQVLVRFKKDGGQYVGEAIGDPALASGVPHGLRIEHGADASDTFLYHANNDATIFKTTLEGEIVWKRNLSAWEQERPDFWPLKPTDSVVIPNSNILLVADGYGSDYVHMFNTLTGAYIEGKSFGGKGNSSSDPVRFNTPHGIAIDEENKWIVVSDRSNNRIVYLTYDGKYVKSHKLQTEGLSLPCNEHFLEHSVVGAQVSIVPSLGETYQNMVAGSAGIYGPDGLLSVIEVAKHLGHLGHQHPHDALLTADGDAFVCCWSGPPTKGLGPAKGTISFWKRLQD